MGRLRRPHTRRTRIHDIADVWQPSNPDARDNFALAVLGDDPGLAIFDGPADAFEQREFDDVRAQRCPFWQDPYADVPVGFQLVTL